MNTIIATQVPSAERAALVSKLFAVRFLWIESFAFDTASSLSDDYDGGYWDYLTLSNGGFYMRPTFSDTLRVQCANGFEGDLSPDAFGLTCCLYAYSSLSFSPDQTFAQSCAAHFDLLRAYALGHDEAKAIFAAID